MCLVTHLQDVPILPCGVEVGRAGFRALVNYFLGGISSCPFQVRLQTSDMYDVNISPPTATLETKFITLSHDGVAALPWKAILFTTFAIFLWSFS